MSKNPNVDNNQSIKRIIAIILKIPGKRLMRKMIIIK